MLEAGVRLAAERGLERITLNDVGEAAGYSRGLPAHHFGTKQAFRERLVAFLGREFRGGLGASRAEPGLAGLEQMLLGVFARARRDALFVCVVRIVLADRPGRPGPPGGVKAMRDVALAAIERHLRAGLRRGEIRRGTSVRLAGRVLAAAACGVLELGLADASVDVERAGRQLVALLVAGLRG